MKTPLRLSLAVLALVAAASALAATVSTGLAVSATVTTNCAVSTAALAFGNYDPVTAAQVDGTGTVTVTCTSGAPYSVGLDAGAHGGTVPGSTRAMVGPAPANLLGYNLYTDSTRTLAWGNTNPGLPAATGNGAGQAMTVYGRITAGQGTVPAGAYADTVNATVNF